MIKIFLKRYKILLLIIFLSSCKEHTKDVLQEDVLSGFYNEALKPFYHGVASGDPSQTGVILWTRITPETPGEYTVKYRISIDSLHKKIIQTGEVKTDSLTDYTVKVSVDNLKPDTYYWYSFQVNENQSVIGRTKTLPSESSRYIKLIGVSCNAFEGGYFTAYNYIAEQKDTIDAVVHLGDYIYESYLPKYINKEDRIPLPKKELLSLQDYRTRYAQYRLDPNLRLAHQMHPFINIWDDHEIANDAYVDGAQGHNSSEGSYTDRKHHAKKAFYEWLPIREGNTHYRSFNLGNIAKLFMLDGRLEARTKQEKPSDSTYNAYDRKFLGDQQQNWLIDGLVNNKSAWSIIGNPVLFSKFDFSPVISNINEKENDSWSGYPYERSAFLSKLSQQSIENVIFYSGDSHSSWVIEVSQSDNKNDASLGYEFGVPSISSENWDSSNPKDTVIQWENRLKVLPDNQHIKYVNLRDHGYTLLTLTKEKASCTWFFIDKDHPDAKRVEGATFYIDKSDNTLNGKD